MKRRSIKQVELYQGNLVIDVPVPSHIVPRTSGASEEMTKMRYTAATCDPDGNVHSLLLYAFTETDNQSCLLKFRLYAPKIFVAAVSLQSSN